MMKQVVILQYRLLHYRTELFRQLQNRCKEHGINLSIVHGQPTSREERRRDTGELETAEFVRNRYIELGSKDLIWLPLPRKFKAADLIIVMQESRIVSNYPLIFGFQNSSSKIAFWGHGKNFQARNVSSLRERWKRLYTNHVDWWFAYTEDTKHILLENGYPESRITVLNNAIDNDDFLKSLSMVTAERKALLKSELDISLDAHVGIFCGSLYPDKRVDILLTAGRLIHAAHPNFRLIVIGDGPSSNEVHKAAEQEAWLKPVGTKSGIDKAAYFSISHLVMNPGLVGLHILDAFCAGLPMVTLGDSLHSPEISYLNDGVNGIICSGDATDYANTIIKLIENPDQLQKLGSEARCSADNYTLENMINRYFHGIEDCLKQPKYR